MHIPEQVKTLIENGLKKQLLCAFFYFFIGDSRKWTTIRAFQGYGKSGIKGWISDRMVGEMGFIFNRPFLSHGIVRVNSTSAHLAFKKGCFLGEGASGPAGLVSRRTGCVWTG